MPLQGPAYVFGTTPGNGVGAPTLTLAGGASEYTSLSWVSPNGSTTDLWDLDGRLFANGPITGFGAAPYSVIADLLPGGGSIVRTILPQPRIATIPLYLGDDDPLTFYTRFRTLVEAFTCTAQLGVGQLVVSRSDGSSRQVDAVYYAGFDAAADTGLAHQSMSVQLYCADPFWYSATESYAYFPYQAPLDYLNPYFSVSPSQTLGNTTVAISGSQPSYPIWKFTGPFASATVSNSSGQSFTIGRPAQAGEVYTVNTAPGSTLAVSSDGTNLFPFLNWPTASLWQLSPGTNQITLDLEGAAVGSSALLLYSARSETA